MDTKVHLICPKLGLEQDPTAHQLLPTSAHRCTAQMPAMTPSDVHQASCCLTSQFAQCPIYRMQSKTAGETKLPSTRAPDNNLLKRLRLPWQRR